MMCTYLYILIANLDIDDDQGFWNVIDLQMVYSVNLLRDRMDFKMYL